MFHFTSLSVLSRINFFTCIFPKTYEKPCLFDTAPTSRCKLLLPGNALVHLLLATTLGWWRCIVYWKRPSINIYICKIHVMTFDWVFAAECQPNTNPPPSFRLGTGNETTVFTQSKNGEDIYIYIYRTERNWYKQLLHWK